MMQYKLLGLALLASMSSAEPPVSGYQYRQPSLQSSYHPSTSYLPPNTDYTPPNNYLPPTSFGQAPSFGHSSSGHSGYDSGQDHGHGHDNEVPKSYEFGYSVKDAQSGNDYDRQETSDGNVVRGQYRVQLPDGRTQIVTYHADWKTGFHADVRYEGEARYPEPTHNRNNNRGGYNYAASGGSQGFSGLSPPTSYGPPGYH